MDPIFRSLASSSSKWKWEFVLFFLGRTKLDIPSKNLANCPKILASNKGIDSETSNQNLIVMRATNDSSKEAQN